MSKILSPEQISGLADQWRRQELNTVLTNGCFDLLHPGHLHLFQTARQCGDLLIVGVNSDRTVKMLKGAHRPFCNQQDRLELVAALEAVDYIVLFDDLTADHLLRLIRPQVYVKGGDYCLDNLPERETACQLQCRLVFIPLKSGNSTTRLAERIRAANG